MARILFLTHLECIVIRRNIIFQNVLVCSYYRAAKKKENVLGTFGGDDDILMFQDIWVLKLDNDVSGKCKKCLSHFKCMIICCNITFSDILVRNRYKFVSIR